MFHIKQQITMSHPNPSHDRENERVADSKFAPRNSYSKSIRRHKLKEIDRKWAPRLAEGKAMAKALALANKKK